MTTARFAIALGLLLSWRAASAQPTNGPPPVTADSARIMKAAQFGIIGAEIPLRCDTLGSHEHRLEYRSYVVLVVVARDAVGETIQVTAKQPAGTRAPAVGTELARPPLIIVDDAGWFYGLFGDQVFLDVGCCPGPRGLRIYDLRRRERCFEGTYEEDYVEYHGQSYPVSPRLRKGRWLTFWEPVEGPSPKPPCPEDRLGEWEDSGLEVGYDEEVTLDLLTLQVVRSGKVKCFPRQ